MIARVAPQGVGAIVWVVNAYQLAVTTALLPLPPSGDLLGYRRVYLGGLAVFTLAHWAVRSPEHLPSR